MKYRWGGWFSPGGWPEEVSWLSFPVQVHVLKNNWIIMGQIWAIHCNGELLIGCGFINIAPLIKVVLVITHKTFQTELWAWSVLCWQTEYSWVMVSKLLTNCLYWVFISSSRTALRSWTGIFFTALNHSGNNMSAAFSWDCFFLTLTAKYPNKRLLAGLDDQLHVFSHLHCHFQQPSQDLGLKYWAA